MAIISYRDKKAFSGSQSWEWAAEAAGAEAVETENTDVTEEYDNLKSIVNIYVTAAFTKFYFWNCMLNYVRIAILCVSEDLLGLKPVQMTQPGWVMTSVVRTLLGQIGVSQYGFSIRI